MTFADSPWTLSMVLFRQPHFAGQPDDVQAFWGYGLSGDRPGAATGKPMRDCTGNEILAELARWLPIEDSAALLAGARAIPCRMPLITSQFMPRRPGDRPPVAPGPGGNVAVLGQFCEQPQDVAFTVEYSVRSAREAVHALAGGPKPPPPRIGASEPGAILRGAATLLRG